MNEKIFRKKSLDKVKSPENLDDYIQVSNPGIWLLLISIVLLLIGVCVWGIFGHIDSTLDTRVHVQDGNITCFVSNENVISVKDGMIVKVNGIEAVIHGIVPNDTGYVCNLKSESTIADGFYDGKIVIDSVKPLSFVLN